MQSKTILLPEWLSDHGLYVLLAFILAFVIIIYGSIYKKSLFIFFGFISTIALFIGTPDAHEWRSSNLHGIIAQTIILVILIAGTLVSVKTLLRIAKR